jgi:molecular chaperone Hsp33
MDQLQPFLFDAIAARGAVVRFDNTWQDLLRARVGVSAYPPALQKALGEMMAAAALLASTLKFNGTMVMQAQSTSGAPVQLMVVECNADLTLRATAKWDETQTFAADATLRQLLGDGSLVITLDPKATAQGTHAAQQGIVPLTGDDVATCLENYMLRSEQIETRLWLAASNTAVGGLMLQSMPSQGGKSTAINAAQSDPTKATVIDDPAENWHRLTVLASTVKQEELLTLPPTMLLTRLYHEETVRVFEPRPASFKCTCSRGKVANMLRMLGRDEVESILAEQGQVSVNCEFCHAQYKFDPIDAADALLGGGVLDTPKMMQ